MDKMMILKNEKELLSDAWDKIDSLRKENELLICQRDTALAQQVSIQKFLDEKNNDYKLVLDELVDRRKENERFKEALTRIASDDNYDKESGYYLSSTTIAKQALNREG